MSAAAGAHVDGALGIVKRPRQWVVAGVAAVWLGMCAYRILISVDGHLNVPGDALVYRAGGVALRAGLPLYADRLPLVDAPGAMFFTYPPIAALVLTPLSYLTLGASTVLFFVLSVAAMLGCLRILASAAGWAGMWPMVLMTGALFMMTEPIRTHLGLGQVNVFLLLLVLVDLCVRPRWLPRGSLVGVAIAMKLTPAVFLLYLLIRRDWKGLGTAVGCAGLLTALGAAVLPADSRAYWTSAVADPGRVGALINPENQSLRGVVERYLVGPVGGVLWLVAVVVVVGWIGILILRSERSGDHLLSVGLNAVVALLISPVSWTHHWVWILPLLAAFTARHLVMADPLALAIPGSWLVVAVLGIPQWFSAALVDPAGPD